jgi:hypothetical protein
VGTDAVPEVNDRPVALRPAARLAGVAFVALLATACGGGLLFANDTSVRIVSPRNLATVSTPVQLRWVTKILPASPLMYAAFVDILPVHPGQNLRSLAGASCSGVPGCVDLAWLNRHSVYLTSQPGLDLDTLPILGTPKGERDIHTVTIVLVDKAWRRSGESAWSVSFALRPTPKP